MMKLITSFQDSEDLFQFIPNQVLPQRTASNNQISERKRNKNDNIAFYTYIKKPCLQGVKVIRIEIHDAGTMEKSQESVCNCNAQLCVQYVAKSICFDDIYVEVCELVNKIKKNIDLNQ